MTSARDEVLGRVRAALRDVEGADEPVVAPPGAAAPAGTSLVEHFAERVADYRATVVQCPPDGLAAAVAAALPDGARVVVPVGLPDVVLAGIASPVVDDALSAADLDAIDAVVTCARVGIAETGTIVLDHAPDQGRRVISLVPDRHVCIVYADQVVADVPDAFPLLDPVRPLTWISGPSATSDIELDRVEGVHGPRHLHVIVVDESS
ncbi:L-lactate dehydrogenase complex protein LldG [Nocardioides aromaticivorans]|uniref:L-lactate dehydrogenase complex protein LldG n=1 Tax=Nocardioides aromaticivorans TaxID=200618 RepID=A0A7Y9ZHX7_9ACTN|nr:LUD domain-containing protein [Nocardioides aromaticivorans]NYI45774.1 L-lactate dehydrogenase complex protein LldG [Nocardioides aromaticivorans]